jgi:protein CpxP
MKPMYRNALVLAVLAAVGAAAFSKSRDGECAMGMMGEHGLMHHSYMLDKHDATKMQARWDKRNAELKAQLKLTGAQESAWSTFANALKPDMDNMRGDMPSQADLSKLSAPERIAKMHATHTQRMKAMSERMTQHEAAVKTFYAVLSPEQQKVFDAEFMNPSKRGERHAGKRYGERE